MSRLHTDLTTSDYGSDYNSSDALRAILRPIGASQLGELERLLRQSPEALTLLSERATLDAMLALANVLSKLGLKRELLNFKTFALGSGIASESSHIGSMGSEHATGIKSWPTGCSAMLWRSRLQRLLKRSAARAPTSMNCSRVGSWTAFALVEASALVSA